jgi:hypothetical protein
MTLDGFIAAVFGVILTAALCLWVMGQVHSVITG